MSVAQVLEQHLTKAMCCTYTGPGSAALPERGSLGATHEGPTSAGAECTGVFVPGPRPFLRTDAGSRPRPSPSTECGTRR
jgi:hypothetical protein